MPGSREAQSVRAWLRPRSRWPYWTQGQPLEGCTLRFLRSEDVAFWANTAEGPPGDPPAGGGRAVWRQAGESITLQAHAAVSAPSFRVTERSGCVTRGALDIRAGHGQSARSPAHADACSFSGMPGRHAMMVDAGWRRPSTRQATSSARVQASIPITPSPPCASALTICARRASTADWLIYPLSVISPASTDAGSLISSARVA